MIRITINTNTAAFYDDDGNHSPGPELAGILHHLADTLADDGANTEIVLRDHNGNRVGTYTNGGQK